MRSADGDYSAIEAALKPHQRQAIQDLAAAAGIPPDQWWQHTSSRVMAKDLAVANVVEQLLGAGRTQRQAINEAAARFDLDAETLQRRFRAMRRRNSPE